MLEYLSPFFALIFRIWRPVFEGKSRIFAHLKLKDMAQYPCENCKFRAHYDKDPKSLLGRFWRWHINFCPGWKNYFTNQDEITKEALRQKYNFQKYK